MLSIGLDLGKKRDHTAIVVVERPRRHPFLVDPEPTLLVRAAERLPLGVTYPETVEIVRHVVGLANARLGPGENCRMAVDATGLGLPVVDMLRSARLPCSMKAVTITGGDKQSSRSGESNAVNVPKVNLISGLQVLLDQGDLKIAKKLREAGTLTRELLDVRLKNREIGIGYGAEGAGEHDDMVIALALAVWRAKVR